MIDAQTAAKGLRFRKWCASRHTNARHIFQWIFVAVTAKIGRKNIEKNEKFVFCSQMETKCLTIMINCICSGWPPQTAGVKTNKSDEHGRFLYVAEFHFAWDNMKQKVKLVFVRLFRCKYFSLFMSALLMDFFVLKVDQVTNDFVTC